MENNPSFDLAQFLPYLLNQAADVSSRDFQHYYKSKYGMLRTEWRVLFHLGCYGKMTAKDICDRARIHKTKVSRAVSALETKRFLNRNTVSHDRRQETLDLTPQGHSAYQDLYTAAERFDSDLMSSFSIADRNTLRRCLLQIGNR